MIDRRLILSFLMLAGILTLALHRPAYAFSGTMNITGFVPGNGGAGPGGTQMPSGEARVMNGIVKTSAIVSAANRQIAAEVTMTIAKTAAKRVAVACFLIPDTCEGVAEMGWMALSRLLKNGEDEWVKEEDSWGPCYTHRLGKDGNGDLDYCRSSAVEAVNAHISTLNSLPGNQWEEANYTNSRVWTGTVRNMCTPALNNACHPYFQYVTTRCPKTGGGDCYDVTGEDQETISRLSDQLTVIQVPATESDFVTHGTVNDVMPDEVAQASPVPLEVENPKVVPIAEPIGEPYPGDDTPEKGPWKQDRLVYKDNPLTNNPTDVEAVPETVPVDNPNTPDEDEGPGEVEDPETPPEDEERPSLCEEHPDISACAELGEIDDEDVPRDDVSLEYESEDLGLPSGCPPDVQLGYNGSVFSFGPLCEKAPLIRAVVVALSGFVALGICAAALRGAT